MASDRKTERGMLHNEVATPRPEDQSPNAQTGVVHFEDSTQGKILVIVEDLFFLAKIREAAKHLHIELEGARPEQAIEKLAERAYSLVVLDLNHRSGRAIELLDVMKKNPRSREVPVLGFLSHVQGDLAAAARASGCDRVMARSAFSQHLAEIFSSYTRN
jgi:PleD family two-component response regulator